MNFTLSKLIQIMYANAECPGMQNVYVFGSHNLDFLKPCHATLAYVGIRHPMKSSHARRRDVTSKWEIANGI